VVDYSALNDRRLWRLKRRLAEAHLHAADSSAYKAAVFTLTQIAAGVGPDGKPINVPMRTRVQAAAILLRSGVDVARLLEGTEAPKMVIDARSVNVALGAAALPDPAYLAEVARILVSHGVQLTPPALPPDRPAADPGQPVDPASPAPEAGRAPRP
jgi:hypothetical protein